MLQNKTLNIFPCRLRCFTTAKQRYINALVSNTTYYMNLPANVVRPDGDIRFKVRTYESIFDYDPFYDPANDAITNFMEYGVVLSTDAQPPPCDVPTDTPIYDEWDTCLYEMYQADSLDDIVPAFDL